MLTKKTPESIRTELKMKMQGVENTLLLTYFNHKPEDFKAFLDNPQTFIVPDGIKEADGIKHINATLCLHVVKSFDDGTDAEFPLTREGLISLEEYWPGALQCIYHGYHRARAAALEKN